MTTYLDHNATTPLDERVLAEMMPYLQNQYGNASSLYSQGRVARQAVETARAQVAALVNVQPSQVIFTSGGTEANNQAIHCVRALGRSKTVAVTTVEHASVLAAVQQLEDTGCAIETISVDAQGRVDLASFKAVLKKDPALIAVMLANNETGVIQDIATLSEWARNQGALFHVDAIQAAGKIDVDFNVLGAHTLSLSAHKLYGPKGVGALIVDRRVDVRALLVGGGQEKGRRSGTENVAAIVGFGVAAEIAQQALPQRHGHSVGLRDYLEQQLAQLSNVQVFAQAAQRLPNTVFLSLPGIEGETLLMALDRAGIAVSSGSACDSHNRSASHVLLAMGVELEAAQCAIRISLGKDNSRADIDALMDVLALQRQLVQSMPALAWA